MPRPMMFDRWLLLTTALLVVAGAVMVGSASQYQAMMLGQTGSFYLVRHVLFAVAGVCILVIAMKAPYLRLDDKRVVAIAAAATLLALVAVLTMPAAGGARRWFRVGPVSLQPAEFAKLTTIVFMAWLLSRKEGLVNDLKGVLLPAGALVGSMLILINLQPDLGSGVVIMLVAGAMVFVAGLRWAYIGGTAAVGCVFVAVAIVAQPYRMRRILEFFRGLVGLPTDVQGSAFQLNQSLIAVGSGGLTGVGFGQGQQKAFYLPAAHTDFIFSVIGEEFGLVGTLALLIAVMILFWRGMRAASRAPDRFSFYLALGCTCLLALQALIHMGVCIGVLPTKGLPMPFVSYGGSSLIVTLAATGLLLNVSKYSN